MRTQEDVVRSVKRYFALVLGDEWEVRTWADEGAFEAPMARISESGPALATSRRVLTDFVLPMQLHCFLPVADTVSAAERAARIVMQTLTNGVEVGIDIAFPRRIPLYDYDGLDESQPSDSRNYYDYIKVVDFSVNAVPDSDVPTGIAVVATLRVTWGQYTTVDPGYQTVESVSVTERVS